MNKDALYNLIVEILKNEPNLRAKVIAQKIGNPTVDKKAVNQILYSSQYGASFIQDGNYEWSLTRGIIGEQIEKENGFFFLTNINDLPEVTIYDGTIDFANQLEKVNVALLSMKQIAYAYGELERHKETGDFYVKIHKWQELQKQHNGFVINVLYFDPVEHARIRNYADLPNYSTLRLLGYHVGGELHKNERQRILMHSIFFGLITKGQVLSHIDALKNHAHTHRAAALWNTDYKFIQKYAENILLPMYDYNHKKNKWKNESEALKKQFFKELGM